MKRIFAICCVAMAMLAATSGAFGQDKSKATIPFSFHVGSTVLPAGTYAMWFEPNSSIWFRNQDMRHTAVVMSRDGGGAEAGPTQLTFNVYGSQYFLAKTSGSHGEDERHYAVTSAERRIRAERANLETEKQVLLAAK